MADIDLKPLFRFPETVDTLISYLETTRKSLRTGQVEPTRHFLQVRLQDKTDREHLLSVVTKWVTLLKLGQGRTVKGKRDLMGQMPVGYVQSRVKDKVVLQRVIEPKQAFTDKESTPLVTRAVPSQVRQELQDVKLSLESFSIPSDKLKEYGLTSGIARVLLRAGLEELAVSDDGLAGFGTGISARFRDGQTSELSLFELVSILERSTERVQGIENKGNSCTISVSTESMLIPSLVGLLLKRIPTVIKTLEQPKYADKYPKLLAALKAVQKVVDVIRSDK